MTAPKPTTILVVRHAEVHNPKDIVYGRLPGFGLSKLGFEQAESLARFVSTRPVAHLYSSPLLRARHTAQAISRFHGQKTIHLSRSLLEVRTGHQGSPNSIYKPGFSFYDPLKHEDDETMQHVFDRMVGFLRRAVRRHSGLTVVCVSHADPIAILRVGLEGKDLTVPNLHGTVYPMRASVTQVLAFPDRPAQLSYFNVAQERAS